MLDFMVPRREVGAEDDEDEAGAVMQLIVGGGFTALALRQERSFK
jgi:hypothetical protein